MRTDRRNQNLPRGWEWTTLGDVCLPVDKVRPQETPEKPFTYLDIASIDNSKWRVVSPKVYAGGDAPSRARQKVRSGDILFSTVRTYLKNVAMVPPEYDGQIASTGFCVLHPADKIDGKLIFYYVLSDEFIAAMNPLQRGTSYPAVRDSDVFTRKLRLPPLPEQRRIVAEIEKQFTRLETAETALKRVETNLKRCRASVLKAACEGKLVPTEAELAEAEGRGYEPADQLLERILAERRVRWEAQGKKRGKYKEPATPDVSNLPQLPKGWTYATVEEVIIRSEYGTSVKCNYEADGVPVLRIPNIVAGDIDLFDIKFATQPVPRDAQSALQVGDVLMCRTNGSVSLVGRTAVVRTEFGVFHSFASYLLRFRFAETQVLPRWFHTIANSQLGRSIIELNAASSAGQHNVNLKLIHGMIIPLSPLAEQRRILAEVERQLSVIQQAEATVEASLKRVGRLRQSILIRAFCGQLVPQNPDDEPASVLLEGIRAEREASRSVTSKSRQLRFYKVKK